MARKKLLTEGEIRQFMKLANLGPLSETYLSNNPLQEQPEEEWAEEEEEEVVEPEMAPEPPLDMGDMGDEGGEDEDLLARVVRAVADELGVVRAAGTAIDDLGPLDLVHAVGQRTWSGATKMEHAELRF